MIENFVLQFLKNKCFYLLLFLTLPTQKSVKPRVKAHGAFEARCGDKELSPRKPRKGRNPERWRRGANHPEVSSDSGLGKGWTPRGQIFTATPSRLWGGDEKSTPLTILVSGDLSCSPKLGSYSIISVTVFFWCLILYSDVTASFTQSLLLRFTL